MKIAPIYESNEWSNQTIVKILTEKHFKVDYLNVENIDPDSFPVKDYDSFINRVFPSAEMRGHFNALPNTFKLLDRLKLPDIPVITDLPEFEYNCDKYKSYCRIVETGIDLPIVQILD